MCLTASIPICYLIPFHCRGARCSNLSLITVPLSHKGDSYFFHVNYSSYTCWAWYCTIRNLQLFTKARICFIGWQLLPPSPPPPPEVWSWSDSNWGKLWHSCSLDAPELAYVDLGSTDWLVHVWGWSPLLVPVTYSFQEIMVMLLTYLITYLMNGSFYFNFGFPL